MPLHLWRSVKQYEGSPYKQRECPVCGLKDTCSASTSDALLDNGELGWKVTTPCIEPVPITISYSRLLREIFDHIGSERDAQLLVGRIRCVGIPGKWQVGLYVANGVTYPHRDMPFTDIDQGFAELLRWLRARQFDPYKYSDLRYSESLAKHDSCCGDDD